MYAVTEDHAAGNGPWNDKSWASGHSALSVPFEYIDRFEDAVGVTLFELPEAALVPLTLVAVTVNVYEVPFVKPPTVSGLDPPLAVKPPGLDVAVKLVMGDPPLLLAVKVTEAWALPAVAVPMVGAAGTVDGVALFDAADSALLPSAFVACTVKV